MATEPSGDPPAGNELPDLAELLADQFAILDDVRPTSPRAVESGEGVVFTFDWPYIPADALIAQSPRRGQLVRLRELLLEEMAGYLGEVVRIERHRAVTRTVSALGSDPRQAKVSFHLGARDRDDYGNENEAVRNWSAQVRLHAREQRRNLRRRRAELRRVRERLARQKRSPGR